jgi:protein-S-isoprenylcysteine O-methyltransferase Ste14
MRRCLACRALLFVVLVPGTVTVLVPYLILSGAGRWRPPAPGASSVGAAALVILGAGVLLGCVWEFFAVGRGTLAPVDPPRELVVTGLYRYTRNPMYNGVLAMLLGEAWLFGSVGLAGYALAAWLILHAVVVLYEERTLDARFKDSYRAYRRAAPRWGFTIHPYRGTRR